MFWLIVILVKESASFTLGERIYQDYFGDFFLRVILRRSPGVAAIANPPIVWAEHSGTSVQSVCLLF